MKTLKALLTRFYNLCFVFPKVPSGMVCTYCKKTTATHMLGKQECLCSDCFLDATVI